MAIPRPESSKYGIWNGHDLNEKTPQELGGSWRALIGLDQIRCKTDLAPQFEACQLGSLPRTMTPCLIGMAQDGAVIVDVYSYASRLLQGLLENRRSDFVARCLRLAEFVLRTHGPHHVRVFPLPRDCLRLQERTGLTPSEIRNAVTALRGLGFLEYESGGRGERRLHKDAPVQYRIGTTFQSLFPKDSSPRSGASAALTRLNKYKAVRKPLVEATCNRVPALVRTQDHPFGRPVLWKKKGPRDAVALEALENRLLELQAECRKGLPGLSEGALRTFYDGEAIRRTPAAYGRLR